MKDYVLDTRKLLTPDEVDQLAWLRTNTGDDDAWTGALETAMAV